jgi:hypothetical protein
MSIVSIFRQSKAHQKSSFNHLFNCQELTNQDPAKNPNTAQINLYYKINNNKIEMLEFSRNGNNQNIINEVQETSKKLDELARSDYQKHKINEKIELQKLGITKKNRTILQSKDLKKEFIIAFGNTTRKELMAHYKTPESLGNACLAGAFAILEKKGLDKKNLICAVVHFDEVGLPHCNIIINDYSFSQHTTATQLDKKKDPTKNIKEQYKSHIKHFSEYQDILAQTMQLKRGEKGSRRKHLEISDYKNFKEKENQQTHKNSIFKSSLFTKQQKQREQLTII